MKRIALTLAAFAATVALAPAAFAQHMGPPAPGARMGGGPAHTMHHGAVMHRSAFRPAARVGMVGPRVGYRGGLAYRGGYRVGLGYRGAYRGAWARPYARPWRGYGVGLAGAAVAGAAIGAATESAYYGTGGYGYGSGYGYPGYPAGSYGYGANYYPAYGYGYGNYGYGYGSAYAWGSSCGYRPVVYSTCRPCGGCGSAWGW